MGILTQTWFCAVLIVFCGSDRKHEKCLYSTHCFFADNYVDAKLSKAEEHLKKTMCYLKNKYDDTRTKSVSQAGLKSCKSESYCLIMLT